MQSVSETLAPRVREATSRILGASTWDTYSAQELGVIALECPSGSGLLHVMSESVLVEVLDDEGQPCGAGEVGSVVVTDLFNIATPLVRYETGDRAEVGGLCLCGRGLPTLARVLGRERNLVTRPDGTRWWPLIGLYQLRDLAPIEQFQLVQTRPEAIDVRLVVTRPLVPDEETAVGELIRTSLGHPFTLRFEYVEGRIERGPGGKFEEFVNRIA